jgi:hypothetical protein
MAYTQSEVDALKQAIATGALSVRHGDKSVTYNSLADMIKALRIMEAELAGTTAATRPNVRRLRFGRGI